MAANSSELDKVSKLLNEASKILADANKSSPEPSTSSIQETLNRANNMLRESSASGLCRRLNRSERLRSASAGNYKQVKEKKTKPKEQKPIEFALLRCFDDEEMEDDGCSPNLKWDSILTSGMLMLTDEDCENVIRNKILDSLKKKYPLMGKNDFEFVKVRHKAISTLQLGSGTEYSYAVVKKMAGQGLLYVKVKQGFEFIYDDALVDGEDLSDEISITTIVKSEKDLNDPLQGSSSSSPQATTNGAEIWKDKGDEFCTPPHRDEAVSALIQSIDAEKLTDPVEILRFLQKSLIHGRKLDIESESQCDEAYDNTNFICVDRQNLLQTTLSELAGIKDYTITFEVEFIGEMAKDLGGPRKEWIRLMNCEIKKKYFDNGLRTYLSEDYYYVGIMVGIALLQNGALPAFIPIEVLDQLLVFPNTDSCIANIQRDLEVFGLCTVIRSYPIMLHLLRPTTAKLSSKMLIHLLKPNFSEEGSSAYQKEKEVYCMLVKYIRQVANGQREPISLSSILIFATGASEEPILGFANHPHINFRTPEIPGILEENPYFFLPSAHTCSNGLILPVCSLDGKLPHENELFEVYDLAFSNNHFGTM